MKQLVAAVFCSFVATGAFAADYSFEDTSTTNWTAFYAGVFGVYTSGVATSSAGAISDTGNFSGAGIGINAGYDHDFGGVVAGIETDIQASNASDSKACTGSPTQTCAVNVNWMATVRGRLGVAMDSLLVYGTAGVAVMNGTATVTPASAGTTGTYQDTYLGWVVGAGTEMKLTEALTAKLEYNYAEFGSKTSPVGAFASQYQITNAPVHTVKFGLNYRF